MLKIITALSTKGDFYTFIQFIPEQKKKKKKIVQNTNKLQIEFKNISISLLFSHKYIFFINKMH